jgi:outer membrane protein insertion porin family
MGPVRVDVAFPYAKEDYDEEENFRFSFGTRF